MVGGSLEATNLCDALIHASGHGSNQMLEYNAIHALAGVVRTNATNRAKLVECGAIEMCVRVLAEGTQKIAAAKAKAVADLESRIRVEQKPEAWLEREPLGAYFLLFEEDREMHPIGGHQFKGTANKGIEKW